MLRFKRVALVIQCPFFFFFFFLKVGDDVLWTELNAAQQKRRGME